MYIFTDGFDCYAAPADMFTNYWDSGNTGAITFVAGRFAGSQGILMGGTSTTNAVFQKASGANDALHHISVAVSQVGAVSGTSNYVWFTLMDGSTAQCTVVFRSDGAILLQSGASNGTTLATYTGAITAPTIWYQFEIEVLISATAGYMNVRKLGNTSNDFSSATNLNTRAGTANSYANTLKVGNGTSVQQNIDDLLWRSDTVANGVPWVGDIRCQTRRPNADASVQWSQTATPVQQFASIVTANSGNTTNGRILAVAITANRTAPISALLLNLGVALTGNANVAIYDNSGPIGTGVMANGSPGVLLAQATQIANPGTGIIAFNLAAPLNLTAGVQYWVAYQASAPMNILGPANDTTKVRFDFTYSGGTFPASMSGSVLNGTTTGFTYAGVQYGTGNYTQVAEAQQDGATSYNYSSTVGQSDLYGISSIATTPASIVAVTTRGYLQKSDAGTRLVAVQLKSGATTVQSTPVALNTVWGWVSRVDTTDPATGGAWTAVAVNNAQIGVQVVA